MEERFLIGYARVSTEDQDLRLQIEALTRYGVPEDRIITEKKSGKTLSNRKLRQLIRFLRKGDRIVVWKLDRLGRSVKDLIFLIEEIEKAEADIVSLTEGIDTTTAIGRLFFHIMASLAEFERSLTAERTRAGMLAKQLENPNYRFGPKRSIEDVPARLKQIQYLYDRGELELLPKYKQRGADQGMRIGFTVKRGVLEPLLAALNDCVKDEKPIKRSLTISRWMEEGCPGLKLRDEDKIEDIE